MHLESRHLSPGTINLRLGAVRRLAYEAADSPELVHSFHSGSADTRPGQGAIVGLYQYLMFYFQ